MNGGARAGNGLVAIRWGGITCRIAAKRLSRGDDRHQHRPVPTSRRRATGHNARERDTGERRDAGLGRGEERLLRSCGLIRKDCTSQCTMIPESKDDTHAGECR